jgi:hypothetical protein
MTHRVMWDYESDGTVVEFEVAEDVMSRFLFILFCPNLYN